MGERVAEVMQQHAAKQHDAYERVRAGSEPKQECGEAHYHAARRAAKVRGEYVLGKVLHVLARSVSRSCDEVLCGKYAIEKAAAEAALMAMLGGDVAAGPVAYQRELQDQVKRAGALQAAAQLDKALDVDKEMVAEVMAAMDW